MGEQHKTKAQLVRELEKLRRRVLDLETTTAELQQVADGVARHREYLQEILDTVPAYIFLKDRQHHLTHVNEALVKATGRPKHEWIGKTVFELFPDSDLAKKYYQDDEKVMSSGGHPKLGIIETLPTPEGRQWLHTQKVPLKGGTGQVVGLVASSIDITEHKRAVDALRRSKQQFEAIFASQLDAIFVLDSEIPPKIMDCNPAAAKTFGYSPREMVGRTTAFLHVNETSLQRLQKLLYPTVEEHGLFHSPEFEMRRKDGTVFPTELSILPLKNEQGQREGWISVVSDITEKKVAAENLRKSQEEKIAILDSLLEHVIYNDGKMRILWANKAACESAHMKREDLIGRYCHEVWADRQSPCEDCPVAKALETEQVQIADKMTPDGRWWHIQGHPVRDHSGQIVGATEITLDITNRKRAENALRNAKHELEMKVKERTTELVQADKELRKEIEARKREQEKLRASERLLSRTFDALQDLVVVIDKDYRVAMSNWKDHEYIVEKDRQSHPHCYEIFMQRKSPCNFCPARDVFASGKGNRVEHTNPIDGKTRDISVLPIFDDEGEVISVVEHLRDITESKESQAQLRRLSGRLLDAQETERRNVALDIHDGIGGSLFGIKMAVERKLTETREGKAPSESTTLEEIVDMVDRCMADASRIQQNLRPSLLDNLGLVPAILRLCRDFENEHGDIHITPTLAIDELDVPEQLKIIVYRISQEALNNAVRHSGAEKLSLFLSHQAGELRLMIRDDGCGFNVEESLRFDRVSRGIGLSSMKERCELSGGSFSVVSEPREGTTVFATWSTIQEASEHNFREHTDA
jgi:PAS domain S-box-containing protein